MYNSDEVWRLRKTLLTHEAQSLTSAACGSNKSSWKNNDDLKKKEAAAVFLKNRHAVIDNVDEAERYIHIYGIQLDEHTAVVLVYVKPLREINILLHQVIFLITSILQSVDEFYSVAMIRFFDWFCLEKSKLSMRFTWLPARGLRDELMSSLSSFSITEPDMLANFSRW